MKYYPYHDLENKLNNVRDIRGFLLVFLWSPIFHQGNIWCYAEANLQRVSKHLIDPVLIRKTIVNALNSFSDPCLYLIFAASENGGK